MVNNEPSSLKDRLLQLSEQIVDLSDEMDRADENEDERTLQSSVRSLRAIGDELVDYLSRASGDDLAFSHFMMGSVCSLLGFWQRAEESYRSALAHWPDHVGILNELFDALVARKKYGEAEEVIRSSIRHGGETPLILRNYAAVLVHQKKLNEAKIVMFNCIARFPDDQESRVFLDKLEAAGHR
ncbi:tetratricopeptide repeat protein [Balneolales bacterium ANBcel1]|nr:tetratricopeptide repeat protein [Balneolales bacterium ANBcel1]